LMTFSAKFFIKQSICSVCGVPERAQGGTHSKTMPEGTFTFNFYVKKGNNQMDLDQPTRRLQVSSTFFLSFPVP
jgi:hypothetical protein